MPLKATRLKVKHKLSTYKQGGSVQLIKPVKFQYACMHEDNQLSSRTIAIIWAILQ